MKTEFHYVVRAKLVRFTDGNIDFEESEKKFEHESPIIARIDAFNYYQSFIDVLLQKKGKEYISDRQAREEINSFVDPGTKTKFKFGNQEVDFSDSFGNGIGVYMVIDNPKPDSDDNSNDEFFIHGIKGIGLFSNETIDASGLMYALTSEYDYYKHYNYKTANEDIDVVFCDNEEWDEPDNEEPSINKILKTPFSWDGYEEPYWWEEPNKLYVNPPKSEAREDKTYEQLIQGGENNKVEFKPSLLYYYDKEGIKSGYKMFVRYIIAKVICSFLNSNGGCLFIGVGDNKDIQGLHDDFSLTRPEGKDPKDYFLNEVDKLIREYFKKVASNVNGEFIIINNIEIFVLIVSPSKNHPIFITTHNGEKEFYVRLTTSCEPYTDIEEIAEYCIAKWGKRSE